MRLFNWTKQNAAYIPEIDAEHRTLYRLGDELHKAALAGAGPEQVQAMMEELIAGAEDHFSHEERLMRAAQYPASAFDWHKQQHDGVRRRVQQFVASYKQGDTEAPLLCVEYLSHWLKGHTTLTDRMMGAYLRNHGRRQAVAS